MIVLRVVRASFVRDGVELVAPFDLELRGGERAALEARDGRTASLLARIAAGVVKPSSGATYIGEFDARLQPAQAKRCVAFVPAGTAPPAHFRRALAFYAAAFDIPDEVARRRSDEIIGALGRGAYAKYVALALCHDAALVVLDQPPPGVADTIAALRAGAAIVTSHVASGEAEGAGLIRETRLEALR